MIVVKNKFTKILSNGSLIFCYDTFINLKQCQVIEKDYKNFFLFRKNKIINYEKSNSRLKYKNQYLL
jgi:hypothetical protein